MLNHKISSAGSHKIDMANDILYDKLTYKMEIFKFIGKCAIVVSDTRIEMELKGKKFLEFRSRDQE